MADVIKFREARKRIAKREKERQAAENRARYGASKAERAREDTERSKRETALDRHKRDDAPSE